MELVQQRSPSSQSAVERQCVSSAPLGAGDASGALGSAEASPRAVSAACGTLVATLGVSLCARAHPTRAMPKIPTILGHSLLNHALKSLRGATVSL